MAPAAPCGLLSGWCEWQTLLTAFLSKSDLTRPNLQSAFHVGDVHVNGPNATDSKGIADSIADALQLSLHASLADYGQA